MQVAEMRNKTLQLLKVLLRLTGDVFVLFVQQYNNISTDTECREGLSVIAELLVWLFIALISTQFN